MTGRLSRNGALGLAMLLAVAAPLPYGATGAAARGGLALAAALALWLARRECIPAPPARFAWLSLAVLAIPAAQLLPVPPSWIERVSPFEAAQARASLALPGEDPQLAQAERAVWAAAGVVRRESGWRPLSADPDGTVEAGVRLALAVGAFLLGLLAPSGERQRRLLLGAVAASAVVQAAYGLAETLSGHEHVLFRVKEHYTEVPSGTFICPNHFAALVSLGLFLFAGLSLERRGSGGEPGRGPARAALAGTLGAVLLLALLWSSSRGALLAGGFSGLLLAAWAARRRLRIGLGGLLLAALVLAAAVWMRPPTPLAEDAANLSLSGRTEIWATTLEIGRRHPWIGSGLGTYAAVHPLFRPDRSAARVVHAHSDYLEWWAETGLPGVLLLAADLAAVLPAARQLLRRRTGRLLTGAGLFGLGALAVHEAADFSLQLPGVAVPAALAAGALLAPAGWGPIAGSPRRRERAYRIASAVVVAALAVGGLAALASRRPVLRPDGLSGWAATAEGLRRGARMRLAALVEGPERPPAPERFGPVFTLLRRAAWRAPLRGEIRVTAWLAVESFLRSAPPERVPPGARLLARHYLERAQELAPADRHRLEVLVRCWLAAGDAARARRVARRLLALDPGRAEKVYDLLGEAAAGLGELMEATPNDPRAALALARHLLQRRHDPAGAQIVLERALARHPGESAIRRQLAGVLAVRGRPARALELLESAGTGATAAERRAELLLRARLLLALGRADEVPPLLDRLASAGADPREIGLLRARALLASGRRGEAVAELERIRSGGLEGLPDARRLELLVTLGRELARTGAYSRALPLFREAAAIDPGRPEIRRFFEELERAAGTGSAGGVAR
ncbi:MAG: hypothetical protein D6718_13420 [Acidobacteria bacterium]|nr:MAG: hypothetical protein D6718_13420 [Acidobacteriota bacterium]